MLGPMVLARSPAAAIVAALAILTPVLAATSPLGLAPLGGVAGALLLALTLARRRPLVVISTPLVLLVAGIILWGGVSSIWAIDPGRSWKLSLRLIAVAVAALLTLDAARSLDPAGRRLVMRAFLLSVVASVLFIGFEIIAGTPVSQLLHGPDDGAHLAIFNRSASVLAIILWPAIIVALRHYGIVPAALLFLVATVIISFLNSTAPVFAIAVGLLVFTMALLSTRASGLVLAGLIILLAISAPTMSTVTALLDRVVATTDYVDVGVNHRLRIWDHAAERLRARPLTGWGLDASRALAGDASLATIPTTRAGDTVEAEVIPLHPHNAYLQVWVELGAPGAILLTLILLLVLRSIVRAAPDPPSAAAGLAVLASGLAIAELSYGIWQGWWQATMWLTAALTIATCYGTPEPAEAKR